MGESSPVSLEPAGLADLFDALHERIFGARLEPKHVPYLWQVGANG